MQLCTSDDSTPSMCIYMCLLTDPSYTTSEATPGTSCPCAVSLSHFSRGPLSRALPCCEGARTFSGEQGGCVSLGSGSAQIRSPEGGFVQRVCLMRKRRHSPQLAPPHPSHPPPPHPCCRDTTTGSDKCVGKASFTIHLYDCEGCQLPSSFIITSLFFFAPHLWSSGRTCSVRVCSGTEQNDVDLPRSPTPWSSIMICSLSCQGHIICMVSHHLGFPRCS